MKRLNLVILGCMVLGLSLLLPSGHVFAADIVLPGATIDFSSDSPQPLAAPLKIVLLLTLLSLLPGLLMSVTAFTRIIIVLAMLRQAIGMPSTPPNAVLISLALFLTLFTMAPVFDRMNQQGLEPYLQGKLTEQAALAAGSQPLKEFMISQTREKDIALVLELSKQSVPADPTDLDIFKLIPAFMLSELRSAFEIGFVIFLPFLLVDIVVASVLMSLGMIMVPPLTFSLPLKILMFVMIDGWSLVTESLVRSFQT